jgi:hypothetical protein
MNCRLAGMKVGLSADKATDGAKVWKRLRIGESLDIGNAD